MVANKTQRKLTPPQLKFCELVAQGFKQAEAYREAYPKSRQWKESSVHCEASKLVTKVSPRIEELRKKNRSLAKLTLERKFAKLAECVEESDAEWNEKLRAVDIDNKMQGHYEPEKREHIFKVVIGGNADE